jgi:hypothetical protein
LLFSRWLFWIKNRHSTGLIGLHMSQAEFGIKSAYTF